MCKKRWKLSDKTYEFIKAEVCHIFKVYKIKCIPVSGFEIASKMKIVLVAYSSLAERERNMALEVSKDGFFLAKNNREYIFYNDFDRTYERQNWTILHEIGHIVLDHTGNSEYEEYEADFFAKYAIAPPVLVDKIGAGSINDVYCAFDISYEAAGYAYNYYLKWKRRYDREKRLTAYEEDMLRLYKKGA